MDAFARLQRFESRSGFFVSVFVFRFFGFSVFRFFGSAWHDGKLIANLTLTTLNFSFKCFDHFTFITTILFNAFA